ncbi:low affinity immunoglobulin gamma Fc region receptor II-b isoform X1 [Sorex fumeus]|uniref:low affinity immunoglobulin gamma Fc region receptor II-b isoform X1 n=1 Tax=Sorex fumeus TaxID=62283 RepID=UPI0024AD46CC|nr:low affinity immunoglobulin gamma Fc region receptor II-b isoform X1 [Sorex fumeus]
MGSCPRGFPLPWAVLLLALQAGTSELPKAEVTLDPPWINVLREDQVTLRCEGPQGQEDPSTHWFHNGSSVGAEGQHSLSFQATSEASGNYSCQTGHSRLSDPVRLAVVSDWLLLQTPAREFREGDPIVLRCHSWRNKPLTKITFYQDGVSKHFSFGNQNFSIPQANASHSGEYHCRGLIGKVAHSSAPVAISVRGGRRNPLQPEFTCSDHSGRAGRPDRAGHGRGRGRLVAPSPEADLRCRTCCRGGAQEGVREHDLLLAALAPGGELPEQHLGPPAVPGGRREPGPGSPGSSRGHGDTDAPHGPAQPSSARAPAWTRLKLRPLPPVPGAGRRWTHADIRDLGLCRPAPTCHAGSAPRGHTWAMSRLPVPSPATGLS